MNSIKKGLLPCMALLTLTGCGVMSKGQFDCPAPEGVSCKSISEVNQLVDMGLMPNPHNLDSATLLRYRRPFKRTHEEVLSVWIAPFEDDAGYLHQPGKIAAVITPSKWDRV